VAVLFNVTFTTSDVARLAAFWVAALDLATVEQRDDLVRLGPAAGGGPSLLILHSDDPAGAAGRVHLDLAAADVAVEVRRLVGLGATLADGGDASAPASRSGNGLSWIVLRDPDGNELCLGGLPATLDG
jgi:catechol 2,3-dioxygenase-like lactoylglutathione lyase family enzyme